MSDAVEVTDIEGRIIFDREKAILFDDGGQREWIPKQLIEDQEDHHNGMSTLTIPVWLAEEKGFV